MVGACQRASRPPSRSKEWRCPFTREQVLSLWAAKQEAELRTEDEKRAWRLLRKYSGGLQAYLDFDRARATRQALEEAGSADLAGKHIDYEKRGRVVTTDIDQRTREVLREIDKVVYNSNPYTSSAVLHMSDQKFPTKVLRIELERELDRLLKEQIMERERLVSGQAAPHSEHACGSCGAGGADATCCRCRCAPWRLRAAP